MLMRCLSYRWIFLHMQVTFLHRCIWICKCLGIFSYSVLQRRSFEEKIHNTVLCSVASYFWKMCL